MLKNLFWWSGVAAIFLIIGIVILFSMDKFIMPGVVRLGEEFIVPDIVGHDLKSASKILKEAGFNIVKNKREKVDYSSKIGEILEQNPKANSTCKEGRKIYVTISKGGLPVIMPDLTGISPKEAIFKIQRENLILDTVLYDFSTYFTKGVVMDQSIALNDTAQIGDSLFIVVSLGNHPSEFIIPDLLSINLERAVEKIKRSGFKVGRIVYLEDEELLPGTVVKQLPVKEEIVQQGTEINLVVIKDNDEELE